MLIIGVTGSFGTGKSTVASFFKAKGAVEIDADAIAQALIAPSGKCYKKVAKLFSGAILTSGQFNRSALANTVFNNPRELKKLTDILFPEALKHIKQKIVGYKNKSLVVLDVPLLFEAGWDQLTDVTIAVVATRVVQLQRLKRKWDLSDADIHRRLKAQMPLSQKKRLADIVVDNNGSLATTKTQVSAIIQRLKRIKKK